MDLFFELDNFYKDFKGEKGVIGLSELNKPIYYFKVSFTRRPILIFQYAIHAREYITTYIAMHQITDYLSRGKKGTVYFVPMTNPDGVEIALTKDKFYKANANMVDLNVNFDAKWGSGSQNLTKPNSQNYIGKFPFSESESRALRDFTLSVKPDMTVSYHSKGEEIYYEFFQSKDRLARDYEFALTVANATSYQIKRTPNSAGGYKDWCIEKLLIPALTIEVGNDNLLHPIGKEHSESIFNRNKRVIEKLTESDLWKNNLWFSP